MTEYIKPATIDEALRLGEMKGSAYLGGGTWLNAVRPDEIERLISLDELKLDGIEDVEGEHRIGAATRLQQIIDYDGLPSALADAARSNASRILRNMATIGGDLALHEPASCVIPALVVLDATLVLAGDGGEIGVEEYLRSRTGSLILEVRVPKNSAVSGLRWLSRTSHSKKTVVCAVAFGTADGVLISPRISVSDCVTGPIRLTSVETALAGKEVVPKQVIEELVAGDFDPDGDFHAGAAYKRYIAGITLADMIHQLAVQGVK